jgi:Rieske Fe-S protein
MPRRDFLGMASLVSTGAALLFALIGSMRLPKAAVLPLPARRFNVSLPESLLSGEPYSPPGRSVAVFRDGEGVFAVSLVCTHLGCIVKPTPTGFDCPCHGSRFGPDGSVLRGPAPTPLQWLMVKGKDGQYTVDESITVPQGTRVSV